MRTITLYTSSNELKKINTDVSTFGELRPLIVEKGINIDKMEATENINKTVLQHDNSSLPSGDFVLFLTTRNKEAGNYYPELSHREVVKKVSDILSSFGETAEKHFNSEKNFTRMKTEDLREKLHEWEVDLEPVKSSVEEGEEKGLFDFEDEVKPTESEEPSVEELISGSVNEGFEENLLASQRQIIQEVSKIRGIIENFYEERLKNSEEAEKQRLKEEMERIGI